MCGGTDADWFNPQVLGVGGRNEMCFALLQEGLGNQLHTLWSPFDSIGVGGDKTSDGSFGNVEERFTGYAAFLGATAGD
jgi:hypothetical protein